MKFADEMDFSREGDFQERLLKKIKAECFSELSDDDLDYVNAAGMAQSKIQMVIMIPQETD